LVKAHLSIERCPPAQLARTVCLRVAVRTVVLDAREGSFREGSFEEDAGG